MAEKKKEKKAQKKRKKKQEYVELRGLLGIGKDYHVYHMTLKDYLVARGLGLAVGAVVLFAFFNNVFVALLGGIVCAAILPKYYRNYRRKRQSDDLRTQFKDLLESLTSSYSAGQNTVEAFKDAASDMVSIYGEGADIVQEVQIICTGLNNNINIEQLLLNFAERIEMEIETMLSGAKNELNIMMVMPVIVVVMLKGMGTSMAGSNTPVTVLVKIVCIGIFVLAYAIGRKFTDIKI